MLYISEDKRNKTQTINLTRGDDAVIEGLKVNPTTFTYPLETPIHHTIDTQVIRPLKGVNNIWSTGDSIQVSYWTH